MNESQHRAAQAFHAEADVREPPKVIGLAHLTDDGIRSAAALAAYRQAAMQQQNSCTD